MISNLLKSIEASFAPDATPATTDDLDRICALLLVEVARADQDFAHSERQAVVDAIVQAFDMPVAQVRELVEEAAADSDAAVSLHGHVQRINDAFNAQQRIDLVERMWRVALADGDLDRYEEYTIRKLSDLLYVKHRDFMQAKLRVLGD